jgi:hypothetical protein
VSAEDAGATSAKLVDYTEVERSCWRLVEATSTTDPDEGEGAVADG